jgi:DNA-binding transcriptional ArsR family regulator
MNRCPAHSDVFQAVAHPFRRRILERLERGELPVSKLAEGFRGSAPALSQQLAVLKKARLVGERREGRLRYYRLTPGPLAEMADWVEAHKRFWAGKLDALGEFLRRQHGQD